MAFDGTNWYSFATGFFSGTVMRASYGPDPTSTPVITPLGISLTGFTGNVSKGLDVVYDSTDGRWFAIATVGNQTGLIKLDFGPTGLSNLNPTVTTIPTNPALAVGDGHVTVRRDNGKWHCLATTETTPGTCMTYYDLGPTLGALDASTTVNQVSLAGPSTYYIALHREGAEWIAITSHSNNLRRYEFGTSLQNTPTVTTLPAVGSLNRGLIIVQGCDNQ
jgi:hypothetical protein